MKNPLNMLSTLFHFTFPLANQLGKVLRMLDMMPVETKVGRWSMLCRLLGGIVFLAWSQG